MTVPPSGQQWPSDGRDGTAAAERLHRSRSARPGIAADQALIAGGINGEDRSASYPQASRELGFSPSSQIREGRIGAAPRSL
jgi:hypothetical protein